jgi:hypothetical protein
MATGPEHGTSIVGFLYTYHRLAETDSALLCFIYSVPAGFTVKLGCLHLMDCAAVTLWSWAVISERKGGAGRLITALLQLPGRGEEIGGGKVRKICSV